FVVLVGKLVAQWRRVVGEVHVDEARPRVDGDRPEGERVAVDLVLADHRRADEPPVERVRPGVVRTLDRAAQLTGASVAEARAAVTAHVVEPAQRLVFPADDDTALACDVRDRESARFGERVVAGDVEAVTEENQFTVELEDVGRRVIAPRQAVANAGRAHTFNSWRGLGPGTRPFSKHAARRAGPSASGRAGSCSTARRMGPAP